MAEAVVKIWIEKHGPPTNLLSDQGTEFTGEVAALARRLGIRRRFTVSYRPQADGLVERTNRTIIQSLSAMRVVRDWPNHLSTVITAINNTPASATGVEPSYLRTGVPPNSSVVQHEGAESQATYEAVVNKTRTAHQARQAKIDVANANLKKPLAFAVGDMVAVMDPKIHRGAVETKLNPRWVGPCKVLQKRSPTNYVIKQLPSGLTGTVNVSRMKKWQGVPVVVQTPQRQEPFMQTSPPPPPPLVVEWPVAVSASVPLQSDVPPTVVPSTQLDLPAPSPVSTGSSTHEGAPVFSRPRRLLTSTRRPEYDY